MKVERIGDATLYCGDCRDVLPLLDVVDAVITDPPYGIKRDGQSKSSGVHGGRKAYAFKGWDLDRPDAELFEMIVKAGREYCIWGGNYFADLFPPAMRWLVWDKGQRINQSDGELAYTSINGALRICTMNRVELMADGAEHPTQKPVRLMQWCIEQMNSPLLILDPFMGSGSTGVAAIRMGKQFIGIERDEDYFAIALRRITEAVSQPRLFEVEEVKPEQENLL